MVGEKIAVLVGNFLDLTDLVDQDYLLNIQNSFLNLKYNINEQLILPVLETLAGLNSTIATPNLTQNSYKLMRSKVQAYLFFYEAGILKLIEDANA